MNSGHELGDGKRIEFILILSALGSLLTAPAVRAGELVSRSWPVMGTYAEVQLWEDGKGDPREAIDAVREVFDRVNRTMSVYDPASDISRANALAGIHPARVDRWLTDLVKKSKQAHAITGGAFSINILNPSIALGIKPGRGELRCDPRLGDDRIEVSGLSGTLFLPDASLALDLGGIAKGYALDRAAQALRARGRSIFFVSLGRDVLAGDPPPGESGWPIQLEHEMETRWIANQSISVSRQGLMSDTGHILNPRTGRPVSAGRVAAVAARRGWVADMASTALMVDPKLSPRLRAAYADILWIQVGRLDAEPAERGE